MKRIIIATGLSLLMGFTAVRLTQRWREERADRRITLAVDWSEVRDWAARQGATDESLLERVRNSGANALFVGPSSMGDFLAEERIYSNRSMAEFVRAQLANRGVVGVSVHRESGGYRLWTPPTGRSRYKDCDAGYDPALLAKIKAAGLGLILRVNQDPWLTPPQLFAELDAIQMSRSEFGVLLNTDEIPGGLEARPDWKAFLNRSNAAHLLFEFHPAKSALKIAYDNPLVTYRAHTIPANELKDLGERAQLTRWGRAVQDRSCRFLLFHISPNANLTTHLENLYATRQYFILRGWQIGWPKPRLSWTTPSWAERCLAPWLALLLAILIPVLALRAGLKATPGKAYAQIVFLTFVGACLVTAIAQGPLTRIQVVPFRGVKPAFLLAWIGSIASLYRWEEWKCVLVQPLRRVELALGVVVIGIVAYVLLRTGNAGPAWKPIGEQWLRDGLEELFLVRPRFKEFVLGYPLLLFGLQLKSQGNGSSFWRDGRLWIGLGMVGPITMLNTFCHLHSPLWLAFWRSAMGLMLGSLLGLVLWGFWRRGNTVR